MQKRNSIRVFFKIPEYQIFYYFCSVIKFSKLAFTSHKKEDAPRTINSILPSFLIFILFEIFKTLQIQLLHLGPDSRSVQHGAQSSFVRRALGELPGVFLQALEKARPGEPQPDEPQLQRHRERRARKLRLLPGCQPGPGCQHRQDAQGHTGQTVGQDLGWLRQQLFLNAALQNIELQYREHRRDSRFRKARMFLKRLIFLLM